MTKLNDLTIEDLGILRVLSEIVAQNATDKGFRQQMREGLTDEQWAGPVGDRIRAAIFTSNQHGEASEFWEAFRAGKLNEPCDKAAKMEALGLPGLTCAEEEIGDEFIRLLDKAQQFSVDPAKAVYVKARYNASRPSLHGGKRA